MEKDVQVVPTTLPASFPGVWQKQKVMHLEGDDFVDEGADSRSILKTIGEVVDTTNRWPLVLEQRDGINTRLVVAPGMETLVEKIQIRIVRTKGAMWPPRTSPTPARRSRPPFQVRAPLRGELPHNPPR